MPKKQIKEKSAGALGWRSYRMSVLPEIAIARLKQCPLLSVRQKMFIEVTKLRCVITYKGGLGGDESECARWILVNRVPDDRLLTPENAEAIFEWVRATV